MLNSHYSYNYIINCVETTELGKKFLKAIHHMIKLVDLK